MGWRLHDLKPRRRIHHGLLFGSVSLLLNAQSVPPLPNVAPPNDLPSLPDLLPYRPFAMDVDGSVAKPFRWRGDSLSESSEGWTIERGAVWNEELLLLADRIRYQPATGSISAEGHIRLEWAGVRLRCEKLQMDWKKKIGEAWALELEVPPHWTLRSSKVAFTTNTHWDFEKVELSACPQEEPGWSATLSSLKLNLDEFATFRNATVFVGPVPVLYLPWAVYPAKAERSSGLISPLIGYSSSQGTTLGMSYYQVIGDTMDATLSPQYYSKEGVLWGGELRWNPEPTHDGVFQGQYIHQLSDDQKRHRFSLKELWQREDGWQLNADINNATDSLLDADYGRGIGNLGSASFDSSVYLGKVFPMANINLSAAEQRNFFLPQDTSFYTPDFPSSLRKQTLPQLQTRFYPVPIGNFYLDGGFRLGRLSYALDLQSASNRYSWNREDFLAHLQGRLGQWGPFRADLQLTSRYTYYGASLHSSVFDPQDTTNGTPLEAAASPFRVDGDAVKRMLGSGRLQLSGMQIGRTFDNFNFMGYTGELKHVLEPFFAFTETSKAPNEGRIPRFDDVDSRPGVDGSAMGEQSFEFGLKQHLLGRPGKGESFADLVRWKVAVKYYFLPILLPDGRFKQGWGSIDNDIDVEPNERLRVSFRRSSDVGETGADSSVSADYLARDGSRLGLAFFSTGINRFLVRQKGLQLGGLQRIWDDRFRLEFKTNYDFNQKGFASSQVALAFVTPCVSSSLRYTHLAIQIQHPHTKEDRLDLVFTLRSLGDLFSLRN